MIRAARAAEIERVEREVDDALAGRLREVIDGVATTSSRAVSRPEEVPAALASIESGARAALEILRAVLGVLHPPEPATSEQAATALARPRRRPVLVDQVDVLLVLAVVPLVIETSLPGHDGAVWLNVMLALACLQYAYLAPLPPTVSWLLPGLLLAFLLGHHPVPHTASVGLVLTLSGVALLTLVTPAPHRARDGFAPSLVMGGAGLGRRSCPGRPGGEGHGAQSDRRRAGSHARPGRRGSRRPSSERSWLASFMTQGRTR